jgi:hypothetical protein
MDPATLDESKLVQGKSNVIRRGSLDQMQIARNIQDTAGGHNLAIKKTFITFGVEDDARCVSKSLENVLDIVEDLVEGVDIEEKLTKEIEAGEGRKWYTVSK